MSEVRTGTSLALSWLVAVGLPAAATATAQQPVDTPPTSRTDPASQPEELGDVRWLRDEAEAQRVAKAGGRPLLVLFQEVPG